MVDTDDWLYRQMKAVEREFEAWPNWMKQSMGYKYKESEVIISNTKLFTGEEMEDFIAYREEWRKANPGKIKRSIELVREWRAYRRNNIRLRNENKKLRVELKSLKLKE